MNRFKKFYHDNKEKATWFFLGVGTTSVIASVIVNKTRDGMRITKYEEIPDPDGKTLGHLYVKHVNGEEGTYNIDY